MKTSLVTLLMLTTLSHAAFADTEPQLAPESTRQLLSPQGIPNARTPDSASVTTRKVIGGVLIALSSAAAFSADIVGGLALVEGFGCGLGSEDGGCNSAGMHGVDRTFNAAVGLGVGAAVTAAIGIPLLVSGSNDSNAHKARRKKVSVGFRLAPTYSAQQGAGMTASLGVHF